MNSWHNLNVWFVKFELICNDWLENDRSFQWLNRLYTHFNPLVERSARINNMFTCNIVAAETLIHHHMHRWNCIDEMATFNWNAIALTSIYWFCTKGNFYPLFFNRLPSPFNGATAILWRDQAKAINLNRWKIYCTSFRTNRFSELKISLRWNKKKRKTVSTMAIQLIKWRR